MWYYQDMIAIDFVADLVELERLANLEPDKTKRWRIIGVHDRLASRANGSKVSEAVAVLGLSAPTIRAWIDAGVLETVPNQKPTRVTYRSLARAKLALDEVRAHGENLQLLASVLRELRDRATLEDPALPDALDDLSHGQIRRVDLDQLNEIIPGSRRRRPSTFR